MWCSPSNGLLPRLRPSASCCASPLLNSRRGKKCGRMLSAGGSRTSLRRLHHGCPVACPPVWSPLGRTEASSAYRPDVGLTFQISSAMKKDDSTPLVPSQGVGTGGAGHICSGICCCLPCAFRVRRLSSSLHALGLCWPGGTGHLDTRVCTQMRLPHASCDACTRPRGSSRHTTCGEIFACTPRESLRAHCHKPRRAACGIAW